MKERPILFNGEMVRAILAGRKCMTRRVVTPQPANGWSFETANGDLMRLGTITSPHPKRGKFGVFIRREIHPGSGKFEHDLIPCPHGQPGDRLWVRETWGVVSHYFDEMGNATRWEPDRPATEIHEMPFGNGYYHGHVIYAADGGFEWAGDDDGGGEPRSAWKPSINMPRRASRILLEIVSVRVERLQEISEADALAEGIDVIGGATSTCPYRNYRIGRPGEMSLHCSSPVRSYMTLWESINGPSSWASNPWVWVVEFKRLGGDS